MARFLRIKEVAERLGVCQATAYQLCARRKLAHVRVGTGRGTIRVKEQDLDEFIERETVRPEAAAGPSRPTKPPARGAGGFTHLDQQRLHAAWRQQGALAGPPGAGSAPSSE